MRGSDTSSFFEKERDVESRGPEMIGAGEIILDFAIPSQKEGDRPTGNSTSEGSRGRATRTGSRKIIGGLSRCANGPRLGNPWR